MVYCRCALVVVKSKEFKIRGELKDERIFPFLKKVAQNIYHEPQPLIGVQLGSGRGLRRGLCFVARFEAIASNPPSVSGLDSALLPRMTDIFPA